MWIGLCSFKLQHFASVKLSILEICFKKRGADLGLSWINQPMRMRGKRYWVLCSYLSSIQTAIQIVDTLFCLCRLQTVVRLMKSLFQSDLVTKLTKSCPRLGQYMQTKLAVKRWFSTVFDWRFCFLQALKVRIFFHLRLLFSVSNSLIVYLS